MICNMFHRFADLSRFEVQPRLKCISLALPEGSAEIYINAFFCVEILKRSHVLFVVNGSLQQSNYGAKVPVLEKITFLIFSSICSRNVRGYHL